jgi:hypothetical protein
MSQIGTPRERLPVALGLATRQFSARSAPEAGFLSQLIAERHHMATQRARRQAPLAEVLRTYDAGGKISIRRMPPGYRTTIDV